MEGNDASSKPTVQIWAVDVSTYSLAKDAKAIDSLIISEAERHKIRRYVREIDRIRALAGKLLIRAAIKHLFPAVQWADVVFSASPQGRPYLAEPALPVDFNISHDGDWVAVAVVPISETIDASHAWIPSSPPHTVGIDVMEIHLPHFESSVEEFVETMDMTLTARERSWIMAGRIHPDGAVPGEDVAASAPFDTVQDTIVEPSTRRQLTPLEVARLQRLYMLWTHKEALTKARGVGLGFDFAHLEVQFWEQPTTRGHLLRLLGTTDKAEDKTISADVLAHYTFIAIKLSCGRLGDATSRLGGNETARPGAGAGGPSLLVVACPKFLTEVRLASNTAQSGFFCCLASTDAQDAGVLRLLTMEELVDSAFKLAGQ